MIGLKKKKLHFRCFLYKWSSVIKEVESRPVCLSSWRLTGVLRDNKKTPINNMFDISFMTSVRMWNKEITRLQQVKKKGPVC